MTLVDIAGMPLPGDIPNLKGFEFYGDNFPLNGVAGGDLYTFLDFKNWNLDSLISQASKDARWTNQHRNQVMQMLKICKHRAGIAMFDVSGHESADAIIAAQVSQILKTAIKYEMRIHGEVTAYALEQVNDRIYETAAVKRYTSLSQKYVTGIYLEVTTNSHLESIIRFVIAGHPKPLIYSGSQKRFVNLEKEYQGTQPLGMFHSLSDIDFVDESGMTIYKDPFKVEQETIRSNDIILLHTDGFLDPTRKEEYSDKLSTINTVLRKSNGDPVDAIFYQLKQSMNQFTQDDDMCYVLIKKIDH
jgi:serine phosphatase RsbU (regulator of sigma subunit)